MATGGALTQIEGVAGGETALPKLPSLYEFFQPGGLLAKSSLEFEHRPGQYAMAKAIEEAFEAKRHLIVEAGTGTGKTLAYLLPALRRAREFGQRIIVSTGTKNLQEQLWYKDIPFLESLLGPIKATVMKGRANYVCKHKLYALRDSPLLTGLEEISHFQQIVQWERTTESGDRAEIVGLPEHSALWHKLDARTEACLGQSCTDYAQCWITQMRRRAIESELIIVNHHLFFADLNIKLEAAGAPDAGILPEAAAVVFDEAHELEDVASQYFGVALSNGRFEDLARDTEMLLKAKQASSIAIESAANSVRERAKLFFATLPAGPSHLGRLEFSGRADFLEERGDAYLAVMNALGRLESELERVKDAEEAKGLGKRAADIERHLKFLMESEDRSQVFWIERRAVQGLRNAARHGQAPAFSTHLQATPIDVSSLLREALFMRYPAVVMTSATLTVADAEGKPSFEHITARLGVPMAKELVVGSLFDYAQQALLYLPEYLPPPRHAEYMTQATEKTRRVLEITRGRAFVLFTSYAAMREMHERLLAELPYPLLMQGDAPRSALIERFRTTPNAVLFGTSSFWQGIDVQGEQLSCVIVDKLPFAVPTDPVMKARTEAIREAGGDAFHELQVPEAVIALKQGFGRLIRSLKDRGVLMLLDSRVQTTRYGRVFLESLPPYRRTGDITEVERFFAEN